MKQELNQGCLYIISSKGDSLRVSNVKLRVIFATMVLLFLAMILMAFYLFNLMRDNVELKTILTQRESELTSLKEVNADYKSYIEKIELELASIEANFNTYKLEVEQGVQKQDAQKEAKQGN